MQRYSQNEPIQIKWFLILKQTIVHYSIWPTSARRGFVMKSQNVIGNNQLAPPHFILKNVYSNSDGYITIHFEKCLSVEYLITYILKGFRWYCRWAKCSSYKRWIIDKLGAGGLSSSQNCKTLPLPTISNNNSNSITFIRKGGGHHP